MPSDRPQISGRVDEDTQDAYKGFLRNHGLESGAFLEAVGRQLAELGPGDRLPRWLARAVTEARGIQADRKDRRPRD